MEMKVRCKRATGMQSYSWRMVYTPYFVLNIVERGRGAGKPTVKLWKI